MNCKEILDKIHKDKNNFIYKYGEIPNSVFINEDLLTRLLKFNEFREKIYLTLEGIEIFGCRIYKSVDESVVFKIALV